MGVLARRRLITAGRAAAGAAGPGAVAKIAGRYGLIPPSSPITVIACEEGWSSIAEWSGVPVA